MAASRPVTPDELKQIRDLHAEGLSLGQIARQLGRGKATISKWAEQLGLTWDRTNVAAAAKARSIDAKAARQQLKIDLLDDIRRLRERAWSSYTYYERSKEGPELVTLDLPPLGEVRNAYASIGISLDKHIALERLDSDGGAADARSMLGALAEGLAAAYEQLTPDDES